MSNLQTPDEYAEEIRATLVRMGEPPEHAGREAAQVRAELLAADETPHRTYTIEQIRVANRAAGLHFFDPDTLRFFGSRVHATTYGPDASGRVFFVSSERSGFGWDTPRRFTVRVFEPATSGIDTHGAFLAHGDRASAHRAARDAARGEG